MITHLVKKTNYYICDNCRMKQQKPEPYCWFCGYPFANYEETLIELYHKEFEDETTRQA